MRAHRFRRDGMARAVRRADVLDAGIERALVVGRSLAGVRNAWAQAGYFGTSPHGRAEAYLAPVEGAEQAAMIIRRELG